jgi:hypothetical protein
MPDLGRLQLLPRSETQDLLIAIPQGRQAIERFLVVGPSDHFETGVGCDPRGRVTHSRSKAQLSPVGTTLVADNVPRDSVQPQKSFVTVREITHPSPSHEEHLRYGVLDLVSRKTTKAVAPKRIEVPVVQMTEPHIVGKGRRHAASTFRPLMSGRAEKAQTFCRKLLPGSRAK